MLYSLDIRNDKTKLKEAIEQLRIEMQKPSFSLKESEYSKHLVRLITLDTPYDLRDMADSGGTGKSIYSIVTRIGMASIPHLHQELWLPYEGEVWAKHRDTVILCIVKIYEKGGEGKIMATERIKLFASKFKGEEAKRILDSLTSQHLK